MTGIVLSILLVVSLIGTIVLGRWWDRTDWFREKKENGMGTTDIPGTMACGTPIHPGPGLGGPRDRKGEQVPYNPHTQIDGCRKADEVEMDLGEPRMQIMLTEKGFVLTVQDSRSGLLTSPAGHLLRASVASDDRAWANLRRWVEQWYKGQVWNE